MRKTNSVFNLAVFVFLFSSTVVGINKVYAHCDTLEGPVIKDAKAALETKDVTPILKWVSKEHEKEVKSTFDNALKERVKDKEKADMRFFEVLVRIHREGEGAPFTGIKPAGTPPEPAVVAADEAIEGGSIDSLIAEISNNVVQGVRERFNRVIETKKHINDSVEAGRVYVAAYVEFVHYVEGIHNTISGAPVHHSKEETMREEHQHKH